MKRFITLFISIILVMSLIPSVAFATNGAVNVATLEEFKAALKNDNAKTIVFTEDVDISGIKVVDVSNRTVDLNGHTISATNFTAIFEGTNFILKNGTFDSKGGSYALFIGDEGTTDRVTLDGITLNGGINVYNAGNVILQDVDIKATNYYAIWGDENSEVIINGGNFTTSEKSIALIGLTKSENPPSTITINSGSFKSNDKPLVLESETEKYGAPLVKGGIFDKSAKKYVDDTLNYEAKTREGFIYYNNFKDAMDNSDENDVISSVDSDVDYEKAFIISLDRKDGSDKKINLFADKDGNVELPKLERIGYKYKFVGWSDGKNKYSAGDKIKITEDINLFAVWTDYDKEKVEAKKPTCVKPGNIEYWYVPELDMYFSDEELTKPIDLKDTMIAATGKHIYEDGRCEICGTENPNPQTGDETNFTVWIVVAVIALAAIIGMIIYNKKKK